MSRSSLLESIFPFFNILEKIILVLFIVGVGLSYSHVGGSSVVLIISMVGFALVNFLIAQKRVEPPGKDFKAMFVIIILKVCYIGIAVCTMGLLFFFLQYKGHQEMLLIGSLSIASGTLSGLFLMTQIPESVDILKRVLFRAVPLAAASAFILYYFGMK